MLLLYGVYLCGFVDPYSLPTTTTTTSTSTMMVLRHFFVGVVFIGILFVLSTNYYYYLNGPHYHCQSLGEGGGGREENITTTTTTNTNIYGVPLLHLDDPTTTRTTTTTGDISHNIHQAETEFSQHISTKKSYNNFTVGICALIKDHEAYMVEWIDYHLLAMEIDKIVLYDNTNNFELQRWYRNTRNHSLYRRVHVHHFPGRGWIESKDDYVQGAAYSECVSEYSKDLDYVALIDADEFLVPQKFPLPHSNIKDVLTEYLVPYGGALVANWMLFGTANKTLYAPVPVLKRFQYRDVQPDGVIKTIVKTSDYDYTKNPHAVQLKKSKDKNNRQEEQVVVRTTKFPGAGTKGTISWDRCLEP